MSGFLILGTILRPRIIFTKIDCPLDKDSARSANLSRSEIGGSVSRLFGHAQWQVAREGERSGPNAIEFDAGDGTNCGEVRDHVHVNRVPVPMVYMYVCD